MPTNTPTNAQLAASIAAQQSQINTLASDVATLKTTVAGLVASEPTTRIPAAIAGMAWAKKAEWRFGTNAGNNVAKLSDLLASGWASDNGVWGIETAPTLNSDTDPRFQPQPNHVDLVDIWNGANQSPVVGDGSIIAPVLVTHVDQWGLSGPGYYEGTFQIPNLPAMWPAWWCIGWDTAAKQPTWGPEIDIFEFWSDSDKGPGKQFSTLHAPANPSLCFLPAPGTIEWNATQQVPTALKAAGATATNWAAAGIEYVPGVDFSLAFHRYGVRINPDYSIDLFTDDILVASFEAKQFCTDAGAPVVPRFIIDFALTNAVNAINFNDFGGANNSGPTNKYRLGVQNIQFWG